MTSSMLAGDRRWASARRGSSMVSLGKVAVPKPINLPSQRLENHGLDPNVEIVPKGSLSWGSRPSSSASNPWGSSGLSPNGDGATGSPSHASGRPSSGGSGTRPSTAGSDRIHEPTPSAWGPNSRPSSASGALTSNQTSLMPLRPHSAETKSGSSQLSRFAEPLPDNSLAWGQTGPVDKLILSATKNDGFSLSSGDFPTLGSEKDNSGKKTESQDYGSHGGPSSSSSRVAPANVSATSEADVKGGNTNAWKRDGTHHVEDGVQPSSEKWQGGYPQPYLNPNVPPQHYDAWNGPPINAPAGVWYRGPPRGPPYGPPVAHGGFPIEPFPYYRPQMPPALGNSQILAGPRGHHPKNGDLYRAQMPDAYMHPGLPIRPGFYPHPAAYENYYGPPVGYCNSNERDIPFMGMAAGPPVFNRYPSHNTHEPSNSHARAGGCVSSVTTLISGQTESGQSDNSRGMYKVLTKPHNEWDAQEDEGSWEHTVPGNVPFLEKVCQPRTALRKNERGADNRRDGEMHFRRTPIDENSSSRNVDNWSNSLNSARVKSPELVDEAKTVVSWENKSGTAPSSFPELPQAPPAAPKDSTLLWKIEGLNAKARASDGRQDVAFASSREEQKNRSQVDITKANNSMDVVGSAAVCSERPNSSDLIRAFSEAGVSKGLMIHQLNVGTAISRRGHHGVEDRVDHGGKGRFSNPDTDGWRKKPLVAECFKAIPAANVGPASTIQNQDHHTSVEAAGKLEANLPVKDEGEPLTLMFDQSDSQAQREKMRELAKQRAIQLQKEEEERIREQKAKVLAKLEELNRRTQAGDGLTQKLEKSPPGVAIVLEQEELQTVAEPVMIATRIEAPSSVLVSSLNVVAQTQTSENSTSGAGESTFPSRNSHIETPNNAEKETAVPRSLPSKLDVHNAGVTDVKSSPQVNDSSVSRHKGSGYKQKHNIQVEKHFSENFISFGTIGVANIHSSVVVKDIASAETVQTEVVPSFESNFSGNSTIIPESAAPQKKKFSKTRRNKNKLEDPLPVTTLPLHVSRVPNPEKSSTESGKAEASRSELDPGSVQSVPEVEQLSEQHCSVPTEESHVKINNHWKSQPSRRMLRNGQTSKVTDKSHGNDAAIWAPVPSHHKIEVVVETSAKSVPDTVSMTGKNDNLGQNSLKSKRAEMERYVPKPVAKELAQQGSTQQSVSSSFSQTTSDETAGRADSRFQRNESFQPAQSVVKNVRHMGDSNTRDTKQTKQVKAHEAWRQQGSTESPHVQNPSKNVPHKPLKPDINHVIAELSFSDGWDTSDGWNMPEDPNAAVTVTFGMKDQGAKAKGKQHPYKGHKSTVNKHDLDQKNNNSGEINKKHIQSAAIEINQADRCGTTKENRGHGERASSHWQPKSQAYSANTQTGSRSSGGQHVSMEAVRKDSPPIDGDLPSMLDKEHSEVISKHRSDQSMSGSTNVGEETNTRHQEGRRERKVASSKERPQPPSLGIGSLDEDAPSESGDSRLEQRISSGFRKHGNQNNQNNRSGRGHESREDWGSVGQDNRHHSVPENRERRSPNLHYEYQPVGPYNNSKSNNFEGPTDGSRNLGSRYRERGQGHSRHGGRNSYARQSGADQVDAGYD